MYHRPIPLDTRGGIPSHQQHRVVTSESASGDPTLGLWDGTNHANGVNPAIAHAIV